MQRWRIQGLPNFWIPPIITGTGKATDFKFGEYIYRTNPNKSSLKILWRKGSVGVSRDCPICGFPLLSQERVKVRTSNFVGTFTALIGQKPVKMLGILAVGVVRGVYPYLPMATNAPRSILGESIIS